MINKRIDHLTQAQKEKYFFFRLHGKTYELYKSGSKSEVMNYIKTYKRPKRASYVVIKRNCEWRLYVYFKKSKKAGF